MFQQETTVDRINDYFRHSHQELTSEQEVFSEILQELSSVSRVVSNKQIISGLIHKLETETDVVKSDIYRKTLEVILLTTPDD